MWSVVFIVALGLTLSTQQRLNLFEGDVCKEERGSVWTCKKLMDCPKAQENIKNNENKPTICNFVGVETQPLVCCEPELKAVAYGVKSSEMCKKYAKSVFLEIPDFFGGGTLRYNLCGVVKPLITNGVDADPYEFPHMALIGYGQKDSIEWNCGGSLISERYVLSAAHCSNPSKGVQARWVRLGDYNMRSTADEVKSLSKPVEFEIIEIINHPQYKSPSVYNDITLYKLSADVKFNKFIRPICLQTKHQFYDTYVIATGWGRKDWADVKGSDILQKVNLTVTPSNDCSISFKNFISDNLANGITDQTMLCAGDIDNGKDTCQGDSGGPLQVKLDDPYCMYSQVGITSFGSRCPGNNPGVYTRVSHFVPWIESIVWP